MFEFWRGLLGAGWAVLLGLLQFENPAIFEGERQLMAKPLPAPNDGFTQLFAFLIELINMLHRAPVCDVSVVTLSKEAVQHAAAGEKANVPFVQGRYGPAAHFLLFPDQHATRVLRCDWTVNRLLNLVERQACVMNHGRRRRWNDIAFRHIRIERWDQTRPIPCTQEVVYSPRLATCM